MPLFRNRFATVLAVLAMAFGALLPIAAQAKPVATIFTASFCGGNGMADQPDHCDHCLAGADRVVDQGQDFSIGFPRTEERVAPAVPGSFLSISHLPAQSRGPPAVL